MRLTTALTFDAAHRILGHPGICACVPSGIVLERVPIRETPTCAAEISHDRA